MAITKNTAGKPPYRLVDKASAIKMKAQGFNYGEIAKAQGVTRQTIRYHLAPLFASLPCAEEMAEYKSRQAEIFDATAARIVASISVEDLEKAPLQAKVMSAAIMTDKSRLVSGQSTQNHAIAAFFAAVVDSADGDRG
jgi:hypothetical protein